MPLHVKPLKLALFVSMLAACGGDASVTDPTTVPPELRLKDVAINNQPAPYYHFEYDGSGRVTRTSYYGGLENCAVEYAGGRIQRMASCIGNGLDHIEYAYDGAGRIGSARYVSRGGYTSITNRYTYAGGQLVGVERSRLIGTGVGLDVIVDKTLTLTYYPDGNVETITSHWLPIPDVQLEMIVVTRFEEYDAGSNVDGLSVIQTDGYDHLVLLPGVHFQKNNPRRVTSTREGEIRKVEYTYQYDTDGKRPLSKTGDLSITIDGTSAGPHLQLSTVFSYY